MKILVVDDNKELLDSLENMLQKNGFEVDCVDNASAAIDMVEKGNYNVVLLDYKMPDQDGIWFMSHAKIPAKTKVLLITAYVDRSVIEKMFELRACGYLIKPFDEEELLTHLSFYSSDGG